jgi:hypothetical protein
VSCPGRNVHRRDAVAPPIVIGAPVSTSTTRGQRRPHTNRPIRRGARQRPQPPAHIPGRRTGIHSHATGSVVTAIQRGTRTPRRQPPNVRRFDGQTAPGADPNWPDGVSPVKPRCPPAAALIGGCSRESGALLTVGQRYDDAHRPVNTAHRLLEVAPAASSRSARSGRPVAVAAARPRHSGVPFGAVAHAVRGVVLARGSVRDSRAQNADLA